MQLFQGKNFNSLLLSVGARFLVGLVYIVVSSSREAQAASVESESQVESSESVALEDVCSARNVEQALLSAGADSDSPDEERLSRLASDIYKKCSEDFAQKHPISSTVKRDVDEWLSVDLSQLDEDQMFEAYVGSLTEMKPQDVSDEFIADCSQMEKLYENFRLVTDLLSGYIQTNLTDSEHQEDTSLSSAQRTLLNFALYTWTCSSMLPGI